MPSFLSGLLRPGGFWGDESLKVVMMGNCSPYPFADELGIARSTIRRITSWNEVLAEALANLKGVEVHVITLYKGGRTAHVSRGNLHVWYLYVPKLMNGATLYGAAASKARRLVKTINPDVVHGIGTEHIWPTVALSTKLPTVITIHGLVNEIVKRTGVPLSSRLRYFALLERRVLRRASTIIAVSPYVEQVVERYGTVRSFRVENPVAKECFQTQASPSSSARLLFVGNTRKGKGLATLVESMALLKRAGKLGGWSLSVVGPVMEGAYLHRVRRIIHEGGLTNRVSFKGFLLPEQLRVEYASSAFLVLPSLQETAPMCVAEALTCGLPVIATDVGGTRYLVADGENGYLTPPDSAESLASEMEQLMKHPELRARCGQEGKRVALGRWRPDVIAQQTLNVYREVVAKQ
jgi:glycosyltransferase involved in cell wall biosynthesis